jgi:SAM-dependent methyltransferase
MSHLTADRPAAERDERLVPLARCWICDGDHWVPVEQTLFDLNVFKSQDPELAAYSGLRLWLRRCDGCTFIQPEALPRLAGYFDRIYDQQWSRDWIENEFNSTYKDYIFRGLLHELNRRVPAGRRALLDVGAHVGRLLHLAARVGWQAEGIELNPRTAAYAAERTGLPVHRINAHEVADEGRRYDAVTLIDVLEHIPDPVAVLSQCRRLLAPGGCIAVKVPCGPAQLRKERLRALIKKGSAERVAVNLVHVNHFSPRSLRLALERAGFAGVTLSVGAPELFDRDNRFAHVWSRLARLGGYHLARLVPGGVYSPLAFNLQAFGLNRP